MAERPSTRAVIKRRSGKKPLHALLFREVLRTGPEGVDAAGYLRVFAARAREPDPHFFSN